MATDNYPACMKAVLTFEGGKVDHPKDPGGRTNQGVIQRVYDGWRRRMGRATRDVYQMDSAERDAIYREQYWNVIRGDEMPVGIDLIVFDGAVNSGPSQSVKWLQRALGVTADGNLGAATMAAIEAHPNYGALIDAICARRMAFLKALKTWPTFGKGWTRRVNEVHAIGRRMTTGQGGGVSLVPVSDGASTRAPVSQAKPRPSTAVADAATGGGVASGGLAGAIDNARGSLEGIAGSSEIITKIVAALAITGVVLTLGGLAYRWWAARRAKENAEALDLPEAAAT